MIDKIKQGFHEDIEPLSGKARKHSMVALKNKFNKENISKQVAITPAGNEQEEKTLNMRFKDSNKFLDTVFEFEERHDITIPLDFEKRQFYRCGFKGKGRYVPEFYERKRLRGIT